MSAVDAQLDDGERVVARTGLHPCALTGAVGFAISILGITALLIVNNDLPDATELRIVLGGLVVAGIGFVRPLLRLRRTGFLVTERRLLVDSGAFRLERLALPLENVRVTAERPRRFADAATLVVSEGDGMRSWSNVAGAATFAATTARRSATRRERRPG